MRLSVFVYDGIKMIIWIFVCVGIFRKETENVMMAKCFRVEPFSRAVYVVLAIYEISPIRSEMSSPKNKLNINWFFRKIDNESELEDRMDTFCTNSISLSEVPINILLVRTCKTFTSI